MNKLEFWDGRAHLSDLAGSNDFGIKNFEMDTLVTYIKDGMKILDIGCGSGTSAFFFATQKDIDITGLDFSPKMIEQANLDMDERGFDKNKMRFYVEDINNLKNSIHILDKKFDLIITERVLINLSNWEEQKSAILSIVDYLNRDGLYLMCENIQDGLDNLNELRKKIGLDVIEKPWHNRYLVQDEINSMTEVDVLKSIDFSSTYYFFSRIINAAVANYEGKEPKYDSPINQTAFDLKNLVDLSNLNIGQTRLWILKNK